MRFYNFTYTNRKNYICNTCPIVIKSFTHVP